MWAQMQTLGTELLNKSQTFIITKRSPKGSQNQMLYIQNMSEITQEPKNLTYNI